MTPPLTTLQRCLRRAAARWTGRGPWRLRTLARLIEEHTCELRRGVELPERFSGILSVRSSGCETYRPGTFLGGGSPPLAPQMLRGGRGRFQKEGLVPPHTVRVWTLSDVMVTGGDGVVWCPHQRTAVTETARAWLRPANHHPLLGARNRGTVRTLPGLSLHLCSQGSDSFYHFLNDSLAKLALTEPWRNSCDWFLVGDKPSAWRQKWLAAAGVPADKTIWLEGGRTVRCAQLLGTDPPMHTSRPTRWHSGHLRALFGHTPAPAVEHIWISRADSSQRHLAWEDRLLGLLPPLRKVLLSSMEPADQIRLFASAKTIVAPHGAGLANLAWVPPGGTLVEIFPAQGFLDPLYARWSGLEDWRHGWAAVDFGQDHACTELARRIGDFLGETR